MPLTLWSRWIFKPWVQLRRWLINIRMSHQAWETSDRSDRCHDLSYWKYFYFGLEHIQCLDVAHIWVYKKIFIMLGRELQYACNAKLQCLREIFILRVSWIQPLSIIIKDITFSAQKGRENKPLSLSLSPFFSPSLSERRDI